MSQRLRVADLQNSRIPSALNVCPTEERFYQWLSEAEERMLAHGRWWGSVMETQWCIGQDACLVFPRQVETVERIAVCGKGIDIKNSWYAFSRQQADLALCASCETCGTSATTCGCGHFQMREKREEAVSFKTVATAGNKIRFYPTNASDVGKSIIVQGRDSNDIWVRSSIDGSMGDGEQVLLALPYVETNTEWAVGAPSAIIKEVTVNRVLMYEVEASDGTSLTALGDYEPGETNPSYRVGYIPGLANVTGCCSQCSTDTDTQTTITAMVSLRHIPFTTPNDWLILTCLPAYKSAMIAVKAWEEGDIAKGDFYFYGTQASPKNNRGPLRVVNRGGAIPLLQAELRKNTGDRCNSHITVDATERMAKQMAGFW